MSDLNTTLDLLKELYEEYDIEAYADITTEEAAEARAEFKRLNTEGILNYEVFHKAYDSALKKFSPSSIQVLFNDQGELKNKGVYGEIKRLAPGWLQAVLKQLWALAFVPDVVASRQNFKDQQQAKEQEEAERKAKEQAEIDRGVEAFNRIKPTLQHAEDAAISRVKAKLATFAQAVRMKVDQLIDPDVLSAVGDYIKVPPEKVLEKCINSQYGILYTNSKKTMAGQLEFLGLDTVLRKTVYRARRARDTESFISYRETIKDLKTNMVLEFAEQVSYNPKGIYYTEYVLDNKVEKITPMIWRVDEHALDQLKSPELINFWAEKYSDVLIKSVSYIVEFRRLHTLESLIGNIVSKDELDFYRNNHVFRLALKLEDGQYVTVYRDDDATNNYGEIKFSAGPETEVQALVESKPVEVVAAAYNKQGNFGHYSNNPNGAYYESSTWRVGIYSDAPKSVRAKFDVDNKAVFGTPGGELSSEENDEGILDFDEYYNISFDIDTSD